MMIKPERLEGSRRTRLNDHSLILAHGSVHHLVFFIAFTVYHCMVECVPKERFARSPVLV